MAVHAAADFGALHHVAGRGRIQQVHEVAAQMPGSRASRQRPRRCAGGIALRLPCSAVGAGAKVFCLEQRNEESPLDPHSLMLGLPATR